MRAGIAPPGTGPSEREAQPCSLQLGSQKPRGLSAGEQTDGRPSTQTELHSRKDTLTPATPRGPGGRCARWETRTQKDERCAPPDHQPREPPEPPTERPVVRNPKTRVRSLLSVFSFCHLVPLGHTRGPLPHPMPWGSPSVVF